MITAEQIFLEHNAHGFDCKCGCQDGGNRTRAAMIKFAKLHVEAALKAARKITKQESWINNFINLEETKCTKEFTNAYPLNNIK